VSDGSGQVEHVPSLGVTEQHYRICQHDDYLHQIFGRCKFPSFNPHTIISVAHRHYLRTRRKHRKMKQEELNKIVEYMVGVGVCLKCQGECDLI